MHDVEAAGWVTSFMAAATGLGGVVTALWRVWFLMRSVKGQGEVVGLDDSSGEFPLVRFDAEGNAVAGARTITFRASTTAGQNLVGRRVTVRYDPKNPERAAIDSFDQLWSLSLVLLLIAAIMGAGGYALIVWSPTTAAPSTR